MKAESMRNIIEALVDSGMPMVFPVHPRTHKRLQEYGLLERMPGNVRLIKPLGYLDMLMLMANARKILTDSGGYSEGSLHAGGAVCYAEGEYGVEGDAGGREECAGGGG